MIKAPFGAPFAMLVEFPLCFASGITTTAALSVVCSQF
jgi:hypothetical protein